MPGKPRNVWPRGMAPAERKRWYREVYLWSRHWRETRALKIARQPSCEVCGTRARLEVHHTPEAYANLGFERPDQLRVMCADCHSRHHRSERRKGILWEIWEAFWGA